MSKEDRKQLVLQFLREREVALPASAVFRNIKIRGATFQARATKGYLDELVTEGELLKVDPEALENKRIVEVSSAESGYYVDVRVAESFGYDPGADGD